VNAIFRELDCIPVWQCPEGQYLTPAPIYVVAFVSGKARDILLAERVALNVLARCSGVATQARAVKQSVDSVGWKGTIAGTRKTTPGFRLVEKYGLLVGGVATHRHDLSAMVMIKDNHVVISGGVGPAIRDVRRSRDFSVKVEVECRDVEEAREAARLGADILMLDNFDPQVLDEAVSELKANHTGILIEASGGITANNVQEFAREGVDIISLGALVQGYPAVDYSMKVLPQK
jgi:nicotinate-nucleotide pyrophosphorylase (carboxylating)